MFNIQWIRTKPLKRSNRSKMPTAIEIKSYITNIDSTHSLDRVNYNITKNIP